MKSNQRQWAVLSGGSRESFIHERVRAFSARIILNKLLFAKNVNSLDKFAPHALLMAAVSSSLGCSSSDPAGGEGSAKVQIASTQAAAVERAAGPSTCEPFVSPEVEKHVKEMALKGWGATNKENGILMHGCSEGQSPRDCLKSYPRATEKPYAKGWEHLQGATLRIVREYGHPSSFWTRTSPDGRFVAHGRRSADSELGYRGTIIDLKGAGREIPTNAYYDPAFTPDNSGFAFAGDGMHFCNQSLLLSSPKSISFDEAGCMSADGVGLYESVGATLGGGDYWVIGGRFQNDDAGYVIRHDPPPRFGNEPIDFTPMINDGTTFQPGETIKKRLPSEGDAILSPSTRVFMTRIEGPQHSLLGYSLHKLVATPKDGGYTLDTPEIARYCAQGAKATFSYDERWAVIHHYIADGDAKELGFTGLDDPKFKPYRTQGGANVYLLDLLTGKVRRVTHVQPGQYALYPHFRSDGWINFIVRTAPRAGEPSETATEYLVASDAALVQQ